MKLARPPRIPTLTVMVATAIHIALSNAASFISIQRNDLLIPPVVLNNINGQSSSTRRCTQSQTSRTIGHAIIHTNSHSSKASPENNPDNEINHLPPPLHNNNKNNKNNKNNNRELKRRHFLSKLTKHTLTAYSATTTLFLLNPTPPSYAGELGARINAAVTQSDLGISVRKSVVKGAQVMDKLDGKWEKFSDDFGLGKERSRREGRPVERVVPEAEDLDSKFAWWLLRAADMAFLSTAPTNDGELKNKISKTDALVRKSFERAGLTFDNDDDNDNNKDVKLNAAKFNFYCYTHFKAFNDILVEKNVNFNKFRKEFEKNLGSRLLDIMVSDTTTATTITGRIKANDDDNNSSDDQSSSPLILKKKLDTSLTTIDDILTQSRSKGLVALAERSQPDVERVDDWSNDLSDLQLSIPLDGDVTMNAQILLQEQGYRLYPDFVGSAISSALREGLDGLRPKQVVSSDEYYMDTSYSSDPEKFEVKQVLLNVVIEIE